MRSFWRTLLLWLTILAVPVQGLAAAGMLHCASRSVPAHEHHGVAPGHGEPTAHVHASAAVNADADADAPAGIDAADDGASTPSFKAKGHGAAQKCSACAACCAGAALPPSVPDVPVPDHASGRLVVADADSTSFIASGPERPPRHRLA